MAIQRSQGDSRETLMTTIEAIHEFDNEIESTAENREKASDSCGDLLHWLFLAVKNKIYSVPMIACCDVQMQMHFNNIERIHLHQDQYMLPINNRLPPMEHQELQRPLEIIANSSSITREYLDKLTQIQSTNGVKQAKFFKKNHKKIPKDDANSFIQRRCNFYGPE